MAIIIHPHALERMEERGVTKDEIYEAIETGIALPAKQGRTCYSKTFPYGCAWHDRYFGNKLVKIYGVTEGSDIIVVTVIVKYFSGES
jgi:hypothetical protein